VSALTDRDDLADRELGDSGLRLHFLLFLGVAATVLTVPILLDRIRAGGSAGLLLLLALTGDENVGCAAAPLEWTKSCATGVPGIGLTETGSNGRGVPATDEASGPSHCPRLGPKPGPANAEDDPDPAAPAAVCRTTVGGPVSPCFAGKTCGT
jgi:hypothetical protein